MLYPQTNSYRTVLDLCGIWDMKVDGEDNGIENELYMGFKPDAHIGVPGSWNEQLSDISGFITGKEHAG